MKPIQELSGMKTVDHCGIDVEIQQGLNQRDFMLVTRLMLNEKQHPLLQNDAKAIVVPEPLLSGGHRHHSGSLRLSGRESYPRSLHRPRYGLPHTR
jgi:hypothetical protein